MVDGVFQTTNPPVKAHDNGDGTFSICAVVYEDTGIYETFVKTFPPLRAMYIGLDATGQPLYVMACAAQ